jgi:acyl-CoA synthetase (AMP-forming)/AMP-acid ligase II
LIELLRAAAGTLPDKAAVITNERSTSYASLYRTATNAASWLAARDVKRFAIVEQDAAVVLALLAGASLAGADACVYPPIEAGDEAAELARRFDHRLVISDDATLSGEFEIVAPDQLTQAEAEPLTGDPPPDRPLLVLTTGTTGAPRGVRHDWARVLRSAAHIRPTPDQRWLLAYGLHQYAGLQVLVHTLAAQVTLVAPAPRRPREGLNAMREHAVDRASATPTFWRFLLAELRSDGGPVPPLRQITIGGEAVAERLLTDLREVFPQARVSQIYAANESGSQRSVRDGRPGLPTSVLTTGKEDGVAVKIVDGELWVRSHIGMLGYYGEPPVDPDGWRPTGDLVEIEGDRIMFRGRTSDVINVGGVKVHPLPIEERVAGVAGVGIARVYGRPNPMTGAIVAVDVVAADGADTDALDEAIREACGDLLPAARPRRIRFVDSILTTGNKVVRGGGDER